MIFRLTLLVAVLVVGCSETVAEKPRKTRRDRAEAAELALGKTPAPRIYRIDSNQLLVLEVPVKDFTNYVGMQHCYIWRDAEFKTATIACPGDQDSPVMLQGPERDSSRY